MEDTALEEKSARNSRSGQLPPADSVKHCGFDSRIHAPTERIPAANDPMWSDKASQNRHSRAAIASNQGPVLRPAGKAQLGPKRIFRKAAYPV
jgi:hypothetical protein